MADWTDATGRSVSALGTHQVLSKRPRVLGGFGENGVVSTGPSMSPSLSKGATMAKMGMKDGSGSKGKAGMTSKKGAGKAKMMSPFDPAFPIKSAGGKTMAKRSSGKSR